MYKNTYRRINFCYTSNRSKRMVKEVLETLNQNENFLNLLVVFLGGIFFLDITDKVELPQYFRVIGIVALVFSIILTFYELLNKRKKNLKRQYAYIITYFFLIIFLFPMFVHSNIDSVSFILSLTIIIFSIRYILYNFYLWAWRKQKGKAVEKKWNASFASYIITYMVFSFLLLPFGTLSYRIFIMFLVYAIYDFMKIKYLPSINTKENINENSTTVFSSISDVDSLGWIIVLFLFTLYNFNIFNIEKQTLYYFYSTISQIFSALLGIVVMFGILILQEERKQDERSIKIIFLKRGLLGFSLLYVFVIMLSLSGVLVVNDTLQEITINSLHNYDTIDMQSIIGLTIFELSLLMAPVSLLYLYALVTEFLKLDHTEDDEYQKSLSDY